ncbi:MAG: ferrous iron transporter B [Actinomycetota bacterium]|nr:ferrous iron transporter B [Actinomycetota bacterium]
MTHCEPESGGVIAPGALHVALVGSPNAGKTTIFNALTGLRAKTANYPGVTVTRREGVMHVDGRSVVLVDLPGTYGLDAISPDEQIVSDALAGEIEGVAAPDAIVMVVDATTLHRSLLFVGELLRLGRPACLIVTMIDEVVARGGSVDIDALSRAVGIPVVSVVGHRGIGMDEVRQLLAHPDEWVVPVVAPPADAAGRSAWVTSVLVGAYVAPGRDRRSRRIDAVLLHPVWGVLVFAAVMLTFFQAIFTVAAPAIDWLDSLFAWMGDQVHAHLAGRPGDFIADGAIAGVGGVVVFLPQIALLFLILTFLDSVGYLARAAFLADRVMGRFGLEGRSFVSMLSSFACAIPGIMSTRTIPSERRRIATMMAAPLMTCSARLPVFTLLISGFVHDRSLFGPFRTQGLALFGLYVLGALSGLLYAGVLHLTALTGTAAPVILELPPYRWPTLKAVAYQTWEGAWSFLRKAGTIILGSSLVLWVLLNVPVATPPAGSTEQAATAYKLEHSAAGYIGRGMEPLFAPLGFEWRTNVALLGSLSAREVFVSTLAMTTAAENEDSLPDRLRELRRDDGSLVYDAETVAALLVFFVYALQCMSTVAVLRRETNSWRWPMIAFSSMFVLAYVGALVARTVVHVLH